MNEAVIPCVMTSITILFVVLGNGMSMVFILGSALVTSIVTSWHVNLGNVLLMLISFGAAQNDTLGVSLVESTLYVRLTLQTVAFLLNVNRT